MNARFEKNQKKKKTLFLCSGLMVIGLSVIFLLSGTFSIFCTEIGFRQNADDIEKELAQAGLADIEVKSIDFDTDVKEDRRAEVHAEITFKSKEIEKFAEAEENSNDARKLMSIMRAIRKRMDTVSFSANTLTGWEVKIYLSGSSVQIQDRQSREYYYSENNGSYGYWGAEYLEIERKRVIEDEGHRYEVRDDYSDSYDDSDNYSDDSQSWPLSEEDLSYNNYKGKSERYDVYDYRDSEDFYDDNYDDFESYEDAETYFEDAWDDY